MPRLIISVLLLGHLTALAVATVPSALELRNASGERTRERENDFTPLFEDDALSRRVRPVLDLIAGTLRRVADGAWHATAFARPLANRYAITLGLVQNWQMFANPPRGSEYLRLRYYSTQGSLADQAAWRVATELVFPVAPDDESHTIAAFWQAHRDKAVSNALGAYFRARLSRMDADVPPPAIHDLDGVLARSLVPAIQYFGSQYARTHLPAGSQLVRTEAWYGWASSRARGDVSMTPRSRAKAVARYYDGVLENAIPQPLFQPLDTIEKEADIVWMLIHVDGK